MQQPYLIGVLGTLGESKKWLEGEGDSGVE
jgi:hypothetical protein